jgi:2-keto-4-pentenoate hydratase/2-oxohepta-3-ene-1,7-dioic acid hydratase in catechol pathway
MRLIRFITGGEVRTGALTATGEVIDLTAQGLAGDLIDILGSDELRAQAAALLESAPAVARDSIETVLPVTPGKVLAIGYNYRGHVPPGADPTADDPAFPDVFVKTPNTPVQASAGVVVPAVAAEVDYEGEIGLVIARRAHRVGVEEALSYVGGYVVLNDVSARDWQRKGSQMTLGKCFDGFLPMSDVVVTRDEIADPQDLLVEVVRDGEVTVSQSTDSMIFSMAFLVHHLSQAMTLEVGDVISTGTPQKLPAAQDAHRHIVAGDEVTVRVTGLGELTTRFIADPDRTTTGVNA